MAKPRVFVSSTFYDLKYIRESLEVFIRGIGYSPVLFENGDIPFHHDQSLAESCYQEVEQCHMLVLIIGGRYGTVSRTDEGVPATDIFEKVKSITQREYEKARSRDIPIFIFVEKNVFSEYNTYLKNRANENIIYAHVDSIGVFRMLDDILVQRRNNFAKEFDSIETIVNWLREQWAGIFADQLMRKDEQVRFASLSSQIGELRDVVTAIKNYSESLVRATQGGDESSFIIEREERKLEEKTIERFVNEPLIRFMRDRFDLNISNQALYAAFSRASTLDEFFDELHVRGVPRESFLAEYGAPARSDFAEFKTNYVGGDVRLQRRKKEVDDLAAEVRAFSRNVSKKARASKKLAHIKKQSSSE